MWMNEKTEKDMCSQENGLCVQNILIILDSMVNMWVEERGGGPI